MVKIQIPTMKERVARTIVAGILACGMMVPSVAMLTQPPQALAVAGAGSVTITNIADNETEYQAWQVFTADIGDDDFAQHIAWNNNAKTAVLTYLDANGYPAWLATQGHTSAATVGSYTASDTTAHDDPQNAAEFIAGMIAMSSNDTDFGAIARTYVVYSTGDAEADAAANALVNDEAVYSKLGTSFAYGLARALANAGVTATNLTDVSGHDDQQALSGVDEGYYLIATKAATVGTDEAGTAPIWMPVGGSTTVITEKSGLVTMNKRVSTDQASDGQGVATVAWGKAADASTDQDLWYRLSGTLPANIHSFPTYHYAFTDTLPAGMSLAGGNTDSVKVVVYPTAAAMAADTASASFGTGGTDITAQASITYANDVLNVDVADLLAVDLDGTTQGVQQVDKNCVVGVYYKAHVDDAKAWDSANKSQTSIDGDVIFGDNSANGNQNSALLTYSKDPLAVASGALIDASTTARQTNTYSYQLTFHKYDKSNGQSLENAEFTIQVAAASTDAPSRGLYVQADGSLGASPFNFKTDANGEFKVTGLDEGVYTIHEVATPTVGGDGKTSVNYQLPETDMALTVTSTLDQSTGALTALVANVAGGENASVNDPDMGTRMGWFDIATGTHHKAVADGVDKASGMVTMMTVNDRAIKMPITGLEGYTPWVVLGAGLLACGAIAGVAVNRNRRKESDNQ